MIAIWPFSPCGLPCAPCAGSGPAAPPATWAAQNRPVFTGQDPELQSRVSGTSCCCRFSPHSFARGRPAARRRLKLRASPILRSRIEAAGGAAFRAFGNVGSSCCRAGAGPTLKTGITSHTTSNARSEAAEFQSRFFAADAGIGILNSRASRQANCVSPPWSQVSPNHPGGSRSKPCRAAEFFQGIFPVALTVRTWVRMVWPIPPESRSCRTCLPEPSAPGLPDMVYCAACDED